MVLLTSLGGKIDQNKLAQRFGRPRGFWSLAHSDNVAGDLNWRENEPPRKPPPAENQRRKCAAQLGPGCAGAARDLSGRCPSRQDNGGPDAIDLVNVNWAKPSAFRAVAAKNFLRLLVHQVRGNLLSKLHNLGVSEALVITETLSTGGNTPDEDH